MLRHPLLFGGIEGIVLLVAGDPRLVCKPRDLRIRLLAGRGLDRQRPLLEIGSTGKPDRAMRFLMLAQELRKRLPAVARRLRQALGARKLRQPPLRS